MIFARINVYDSNKLQNLPCKKIQVILATISLELLVSKALEKDPEQGTAKAAYTVPQDFEITKPGVKFLPPLFA